MGQHFLLLLWGSIPVPDHVINLLIFFRELDIHVCLLWCVPRTGESSFEEKDERFREWTSRRPWKERKRAAKARETMFLQSVTASENPELIFYGRHSGVVGLSKNKLYKTMSDLKVSSCGYDKVKLYLVLNHLRKFTFLLFCFILCEGKLIGAVLATYQVLVDAECTHDGSVKHIQKFEQWGWTTLQRRVLDALRTDSLTLLQAMPFFHHDLYTYKLFARFCFFM